MTEDAKLRRALEKVLAALEAQEKLRDVLPDDQLDGIIAALEAQHRALEVQISGSGAIAQGNGAVAAGAGGLAVGGDLNLYAEEPQRPDARSLRRAYLSRVKERCGYLTLSGVDPSVAGRKAETRLHLDAVYTALLTLSPEARSPNKEEHRSQELGEEARLSALEQLNRHRRLVLQGDPGSGKSTFVNFRASLF